MDILLEIIALLILAKILGELLEQVGIPSMIGEIGAGAILGPAVLGWVVMNPTLELFSEIGVIALLFISGAEMNISTFSKSKGVALSTAVSGVAIPFIFGTALGTYFGYSLYEVLFLAITLSITSIGISVRTLIDQKQLNTPVGTTVVSAAVVDDIIGIFLLALLSSIAVAGSDGTGGIMYSVVGGLIFLVVFLTLGRRLIDWIFVTVRRSETHEMVYSTALILALVSAYIAHNMGLHYTIGAFLAGLILGGEIRKDRPLMDSLMDFGFGFFVTLFFASVGLLFTISLEAFFSPLILPLILLAFGGKILGGFLGSVKFLNPREALSVGFGLCPRGEIALIIAKISLAAGIITGELYSSVTVMVIITILATPFLMKAGFSYGSSKS